MIGNIVLMATALAASAYSTVKAIQDPAFDFRFAIPQNQEPSTTPRALPPSGGETLSSSFSQGQSAAEAFPAWTSQTDTFSIAPRASNPEDQRKVTVAFHSTRAGDVLSWLEHQGVSFIITDESLKSKTITMNVVNQSLGETVDGIATVLGGHWTHRGSIRVFQPGLNFFSFGIPESTSAQNSERLLEKAYGNGMISKGFLPALPPKNGSFSYRQFGNSNGIPGKDSRTFTFSSNAGKPFKLNELLSSLTARQKELQRSQGYLTPSDLTESQRSMLNITSDSEMDLTIKVNDQVLILRSHGKASDPSGDVKGS